MEALPHLYLYLTFTFTFTTLSPTRILCHRPIFCRRTCTMPGNGGSRRVAIADLVSTVGRYEASMCARCYTSPNNCSLRAAAVTELPGRFICQCHGLHPVPAMPAWICYR